MARGRLYSIRLKQPYNKLKGSYTLCDMLGCVDFLAREIALCLLSGGAGPGPCGCFLNVCWVLLALRALPGTSGGIATLKWTESTK